MAQDEDKADAEGRARRDEARFAAEYRERIAEVDAAVATADGVMAPRRTGAVLLVVEAIASVVRCWRWPPTPSAAR